MEKLQALNCKQVPDLPGVYQVLWPHPMEPEFLDQSVGGWFKGRRPTVSTSILAERWVPGPVAVYYGKAGGPGRSATLRTRLRAYMAFGLGKRVPHWGGRYVWQLKGHTELLVAWKPLPAGKPAQVEGDIIRAFVAKHGKKPFANLR